MTLENGQYLFKLGLDELAFRHSYLSLLQVLEGEEDWLYFCHYPSLAAMTDLNNKSSSQAINAIASNRICLFLRLKSHHPGYLLPFSQLLYVVQPMLRPAYHCRLLIICFFPHLESDRFNEVRHEKGKLDWRAA
jgi:hypothetical protein